MNNFIINILLLLFTNSSDKGDLVDQKKEENINYNKKKSMEKRENIKKIMPVC